MLRAVDGGEGACDPSHVRSRNYSTPHKMSFSRTLLKTLVPESPFLRHQPTLYETISRLPRDGLGSRVRQRRWDTKGFDDTYWEITRVRLKNEGKNGRVWGKLFWKGESLSLRV